MMAQRISMVSGVAQVQIMGAATYAVRIQVDPTALAAKGIGIDEVASAVRSWNVNRPTGELYGPTRTYTIQASGQLTRAEAYRPLVVAYRNGSPDPSCRKSPRSSTASRTTSPRPGTTTRSRAAAAASSCRFRSSPGTNTIEVVDAVSGAAAGLPGAASSFRPPGSHVRPVADASGSRSTTSSSRMLLALGLVIMVIFIFLRNVSATLIPSLALPFSIIGTFSVMYLLGYSLNNLSMMALILSVGFVVDDAIVMLENIVRHTEHGESADAASLRGSREIGFTILSMTLSLAAVFIPVLFLGGIVGRLFREFAVTIATAILISGVVSITLTPMLCSRFLRPPSKRRPQLALRPHGSASSTGCCRVYGKTLRWTLRFRPVMLVHLVRVDRRPPSTCSWRSPKASSPARTPTSSASRGGRAGHRRPRTCSGTCRRCRPSRSRTRTWIASTPRRRRRQGRRRRNTGRLQLRLKPRDGARTQRRPGHGRTAAQDWRWFPESRSSFRIRRRSASAACMTRAQYQYTLQGPDTAGTVRCRPEIREGAERAAGSASTCRRTCLLKKPMLNVDIDRDKAAALRLTVDQIENALVQRLQHALHLQHLHAVQPVPGHHGGAAGVSRTAPTTCPCSTSDRATATWCRWTTVTSTTSERGPLNPSTIWANSPP